jgi:flagellar protein FliS
MTPPTAAPQQAYRENAVLSATPAQLVVMLYDGARQFLRRAAEAMRAGEVERAHNSLRRAEQIVAHLDGVLDHEQGAELAGRLQAIYSFCLAHLGRARWSQDAEKVEEVGEILGELRASWAEIAHR